MVDSYDAGYFVSKSSLSPESVHNVQKEKRNSFDLGKGPLPLSVERVASGLGYVSRSEDG